MSVERTFRRYFHYRGLLALAIGLFAPVLLGAWFAYYHAHYYSQVTATVTAFTWDREIHIQKIRWDSQSNESGCPGESRNCTSHWEVVRWDQRYSGQTCTTQYSGYGSSKTSYQSCKNNYDTVPVYGWVYYFDEPVWHDEYTARASDTKQSVPFWPTFRLVTNTDTPERAADRFEHYYVMLTSINGGAVYQYKVAYLQWKAYVLGTGYTLKVHDHDLVSLVMN